jgi:predicted O-methyltransferase YrrM
MLRFGAPGLHVVLLHDPVDPRPRQSIGALARIFERHVETYRQTMNMIATSTEHLGADALPWSNRFLPPLDAASLYAFVWSRKPRRYLEIGSGNSTIFARRAISDSGASTRIVSIDPQPREDIDDLCDEAIRAPLQDAELATFRKLTSGDVLFFDGSHQAFPNSDVTVFFTEILPSLPAGVVVGLHDIYLPDDYPAWAAATLPNEQYLLASWLLGRANADGVLLPAAFVHRYTDLVRILQPLLERVEQRKSTPAAFWFETSGEGDARGD